METVLGLIGLVLFICAVIMLAAGVTYAVIRLTPQRPKREATDA
jgi:hypothetical protein